MHVQDRARESGGDNMRSRLASRGGAGADDDDDDAEAAAAAAPLKLLRPWRRCCCCCANLLLLLLLPLPLPLPLPLLLLPLGWWVRQVSILRDQLVHVCDHLIVTAHDYRDIIIM